MRGPLWQNRGDSQHKRDAGWFCSRLSFPQDDAISRWKSDSGDLILVFSSLFSRVFTLYGHETPATTRYSCVIEYVRFVSFPCVSCGRQGGIF